LGTQSQKVTFAIFLFPTVAITAFFEQTRSRQVEEELCCTAINIAF